MIYGMQSYSYCVSASHGAKTYHHRVFLRIHYCPFHKILGEEIGTYDKRSKEENKKLLSFYTGCFFLLVLSQKVLSMELVPPNRKK